MLKLNSALKNEQKKSVKSAKKLTRLEGKPEKYSSFQNEHTLIPTQEISWYHKTLSRVKEMTNHSTIEILQSLLSSVEYHPEIKKRIKKQIKILSKETCNKTIEDCLQKIMQGYTTRKENPRQVKTTKKRCHFCRERGHIEKDCKKRKRCRNWLWKESSHLQ